MLLTVFRFCTSFYCFFSRCIYLSSVHFSSKNTVSIHIFCFFSSLHVVRKEKTLKQQQSHTLLSSIDTLINKSENDAIVLFCLFFFFFFTHIHPHKQAYLHLLCIGIASHYTQAPQEIQNLTRLVAVAIVRPRPTTTPTPHTCPPRQTPRYPTLHTFQQHIIIRFTVFLQLSIVVVETIRSVYNIFSACQN